MTIYDETDGYIAYNDKKEIVAVCAKEVTARRLGKEVKLFKVDGIWYGPVKVEYPNQEDRDRERDQK